MWKYAGSLAFAGIFLLAMTYGGSVQSASGPGLKQLAASMQEYADMDIPLIESSPRESSDSDGSHVLFFDDFLGTQLDTSRWHVLSGQEGISVSGGFLTMQGSPDHKRIDTQESFGSAYEKIVARARIALGGDYQKFGVRVNPLEYPGPTNGFYFDTYSRYDQTQGKKDHIHALVWQVPESGAR